jgi:hypothetical protein
MGANVAPRLTLYDGINGTGNILLTSASFGDYNYDQSWQSINDRTKSVRIDGDALLTIYQHYITSDSSQLATFGQGTFNIPSTWSGGLGGSVCSASRRNRSGDRACDLGLEIFRTTK